MNEKLEVNPPASAMATPTDDSANAAYLWFRQDKCIPSAYRHLSFSSSDPLIATSKTSHQAWTKLTKIYASRSMDSCHATQRWTHHPHAAQWSTYTLLTSCLLFTHSCSLTLFFPKRTFHVADTLCVPTSNKKNDICSSFH